MAEAIWSDLARRFAIDLRRAETWTVQRPGQFQALVRSGAFGSLGSAELCKLADEFFGAGGWKVPRWWGQPLVTFPSGGAWDVPHATWHLDLPASDSLEDLPAIRVFAFLEPVAPEGGGTPFVAGSHRVVMDRARQARRGQALRSADMRDLLKAEEPWLAALCSAGGRDRVARFMQTWGTMRGTPVRVEEMTGEPGDIIIMHPATFHTVAPNGLDRPGRRLVETIYRR